VRNDRSITAGGYPGFDIAPPGQRPEYWVIEFLEPMELAAVVFGMDIRERAPALEAAERSRDTGEPSATGRYRLLQEKGSSYGLVLYLPVYGTERARTVAQRRATRCAGS